MIDPAAPHRRFQLSLCFSSGEGHRRGQGRPAVPFPDVGLELLLTFRRDVENRRTSGQNLLHQEVFTQTSALKKFLAHGNVLLASACLFADVSGTNLVVAPGGY